MVKGARSFDLWNLKKTPGSRRLLLPMSDHSSAKTDFRDNIAGAKNAAVMRQGLVEEDLRITTKAYDRLLALLAYPPFEESALRESLRSARAAFLPLLAKGIKISTAIDEFANELAKAQQLGIPRTDSFCVYNASVMLNMLAIGFERGGVTGEVLQLLDADYIQTLRRYLTIEHAQVDALCRYLVEIAQAAVAAVPCGGRIILLDFPVGNSLPTQVLKEVIQRSHPVGHLVISLQRNDAPSKGLTRKQVIAAEMQKVHPSASDLFLYFDEWNIGTAFNIVCEILCDCIAEARLLPAAVLSPRSLSNAKHIATHDKILRGLNLSGTDFRLTLPNLTTQVSDQLRASPFFWGEKDRLSGFRKMQTHGAIFSSMDAVIERLMKDDEALNQSATFLLGQLAQASPLPTTPGKGIRITAKLIRDAYSDYAECKETIRNCCEQDAVGLQHEDFDEALRGIIANYAKIVENRPAKKIICAASAYLHRLGGLDPENQYLFKHHAPALIRLSGPYSRPHDVALNHILQRVASLMANGFPT